MCVCVVAKNVVKLVCMVLGNVPQICALTGTSIKIQTASSLGGWLGWPTCRIITLNNYADDNNKYTQICINALTTARKKNQTSQINVRAV